MTEPFTRSAWDRFVDYARFVLANPLFSHEERERRRLIEERVRYVLEAVKSETSLNAAVASLVDALSQRGRPYDFTTEGQGFWLREWARNDEGSLRVALKPFCDTGDAEANLETFVAIAEQSAGADAEGRPLAALTTGSLLSASLGRGAVPFVRFQPFERLQRDLGYMRATSDEPMEQYVGHLEFARLLHSRLHAGGVELRDIRDAEALILLASRRGEGWLTPLPEQSLAITKIRRPQPRGDRVYLAVAACLGYDSSYLLEWLEFHRLVGVERFFLYNNQEREVQAELLEPYVRDGTVVLHDWPRFPPQVSAFMHCVANHWSEARWIAFLDTDEFLSATEAPLREVLESYEDAPAIGVNRALFGPSGHLTRPRGLVIENYLVRLNTRNERAIKSIVNPAEVTTFATIHNFQLRGGQTVDENHYPIRGFMTTYVSTARLQVNHYHTKSAEEMRLKYSRPRIGTGIDTDGEWEASFERLVAKEARYGTEDLSILRFLPALRAAVGAG